MIALKEKKKFALSHHNSFDFYKGQVSITGHNVPHGKVNKPIETKEGTYF